MCYLVWLKRRNPGASNHSGLLSMSNLWKALTTALLIIGESAHVTIRDLADVQEFMCIPEKYARDWNAKPVSWVGYIIGG